MPTRLTNSNIGRFERDLLRRKAKTYEFGSDDDISGKSPILGCPPVVGFREGAARDLEGILLVCADWRDQVGGHSGFRACTLRHSTQVGGWTLPTINVWEHS